MNVITKTVQLADGRTITIETGKVAKQADGSVMLRMNNTVLLATVCAAKDAVPGTDFMPLQVDYREQYSAAGRFPGGFTKREGKPSDNEILTSRLVDRVLRPLFPSNYHAEVFVNVMLLSADGVDQPDALAGFAASAALACSDIPFECPISEVRVARVNGEYVIDPTFEQMKQADMDIMVGASAENIMMVEGEMKEVSEQDLLGALKAAMEAIKPMCELQTQLSKELGKDVKREYNHEVNDEALRERMNKELYQPAYDITKQALPKQDRADAFEKLLADFKEKFFAERKEALAGQTAENTVLDGSAVEISDDEYEAMMERYYHDVERDAMRRCILDEGQRLCLTTSEDRTSVRHGQRRNLAPDGADLVGLTTVQTDTLVQDATAHSVALYIVVVAVHHSVLLFQLVLSQVGMLSSILLLEVGQNLLEGLSTGVLLEGLLGHVVGGLIELLVHLLAQCLVVHLVVILALHVLAQLLRELGLQLTHGLDGSHSSLQRTEQILLTDFLHLTFYHHDVLSRSTYHDVHIGLLHLLEGRINHILAIDASHANLRDRTLEGDI